MKVLKNLSPQILEEDLTILRRRLDEAKRKRSRLKQSIGMARVQSIRSSLTQARTGLGETVRMIGEKTEEAACEWEEKLGRIAKRSMQNLMTAVSYPTSKTPPTIELSDSATTPTTPTESVEAKVSVDNNNG